MQEIQDFAQNITANVEKVIVGKAEFDRRRRKHGPKGTLLTFLRGLSFRASKLDFERAKDDDRKLEL